MDTINFDFYTIGVSVRSSDPVVIDNIRRDFSYFHRADIARADIVLQVYNEPPDYSVVSRLKPALRFNTAACYDKQSIRYIDYQGKALAICDYDSEEIKVYSQDEDLLHEIPYLLLHSRLGVLLDGRGLHRIHALGFSMDNNAVLCLLPSGGGKTCLGLRLLRDPRIKILSDDTPLLTREGMVLPFPIRIGAYARDVQGIPQQYVRDFRRRRHGAKKLVDIEYFHNSIGKPGMLRMILIGRRRDSCVPVIRPLRRISAIWPCFVSGAIGIGLPQIKECMLKPGISELRKNASVICKRAGVLMNAIRACGTYIFHLNSDGESNYDILMRYISKEIRAIT
ncbi:MAG: hypothetical protein PHR44_00760 [Candidatus Omnitrophica bacterium]|nr:hypothetical protein [Candidatus Omnitrophota bacterium]